MYDIDGRGRTYELIERSIVVHDQWPVICLRIFVQTSIDQYMLLVYRTHKKMYDNPVTLIHVYLRFEFQILYIPYTCSYIVCFINFDIQDVSSLLSLLSHHMYPKCMRDLRWWCLWKKTINRRRCLNNVLDYVRVMSYCTFGI